MQRTTGKIPSATCKIYGQNIETNSENNFDVRSSHAEMFFKNWHLALAKSCVLMKLIMVKSQSQ